MLKRLKKLFIYCRFLNTIYTYNEQGVVNTTSKRHILPCDSNSVFWEEGFWTDYTLSDIPRNTFSHLNTKLIRTSLKKKNNILSYKYIINIMVTSKIYFFFILYAICNAVDISQKTILKLVHNDGIYRRDFFQSIRIF